MSGWLDGQVVLIVGGGAGLGLAQVERFRAEGASLAVLELVPERCRQLGESYGDELLIVTGDATTYAANNDLVEQALSRFGRIDAVVANTGLWDFGTSLDDLPAGELLADAFRELFEVNVLAYLLAARAAADALRSSAGTLILTASPAAFHAGNGGPLYAASKHAVVGLVRQLAYDLAPEIRVNGVSPGGMATALRGPRALGLDDRVISAESIERSARLLSPVAFLPAAEDYLGAYVMLASRANSRTITGEVIECDGGERVRGRWGSEMVRRGVDSSD